MSDKQYLAAAQTFLSTLVEKGTDRYGKRHTPVLCLSLDPETYAPPKAPEKIDRDYAIGFEYLYRDFGFYWKSHLHGSNLIYDQGTIRALYAATEATGDPRFAKAADAYLDFFLGEMVSTQTGIFGWGEHIFYNVFLDYIIGGCFQTSGWHYFYYGHELERWTTIYDLLWERDPEKTRIEIEGIYDYKIHDYDTFVCNRHSEYHQGKSSDLYTFIKHTGLFTHAFALAHAKTGDPKYLEWAKKMSEVFWNVRNTDTNLIRGCVQTTWGGPQTSGGSGIGEISLFLMRAYQWSPEPGILEKAHAYLKAYYRYFKIDDEGNFHAVLNCDGTDAKPGVIDDYWEGPLRVAKAAALAYSLTRDPHMLYLADLVVSNLTADIQCGGTVERSRVSDAIEARSTALSTTIDLYELTGDVKYLAKARELADDAIRKWLQNGLFVSELYAELNAMETVIQTVYDARAGSGWLALNLMRLQRDLDTTEAGTFKPFEQLERIYD